MSTVNKTSWFIEKMVELRHAHLGMVPEKLLIRFNLPILATRDFERARIPEEESILVCLSVNKERTKLKVQNVHVNK